MPEDRASSKHGQVVDDSIRRDVEGYVRAGHDTRTEEWRSPEPPAEDATGRSVTDRRGTPPGMSVDDVEKRSELAGWLGRAVFPADRRALLDWLRGQHAPDRVLSEVAAAPDDIQFGSVGELWRALHAGEHVEARRT